MKHLKEKILRKGVHVSVALLFVGMTGAAILSMGVTTMPVFAAPPSGETPGHSEGHGTPRTEPGQVDDPECWGEATEQLAKQDDGKPGIGEHASDPMPGGDNETPRLGIGNQKEDTPAEHAEVMAPLFGISCEDERDD
jgi:hypothetical protein